MKNVLIVCFLFIAIASAADYEFNNKSCFIKINSETLKYSFSDSCPKIKKDSSGYPSNVFFLNCTRGSDLNSKVDGIDIFLMKGKYLFTLMMKKSKRFLLTKQPTFLRT